MRVALVGPTYPFRGGVALYTTLLCRALRRDHEVRFVSFSRQYPRILFPGRTDRLPGRPPVEAGDVSYLLDSLNPVTWHTTAVEIARFSPDVLILPWWVVFWAPHFAYITQAVRRLTGCSVTFVCHNVVEHEANRLKKWISRAVLSMPDRIVTHSEEETERARQLVGGATDIVTGYHPTYAALAEDTTGQRAAQSELGVEGPVLLFFGFVRHYKGLHVLLKALPRVLRERSVTLVVAGEFWKDTSSYLDDIRRLGVEDHVHIEDRYIPHEELATYFGAADLVVQPYLSASGSGVCQLAYGFNRPVIATRVGSLPEVIEDGHNGRLVPPGDEKRLASAILDSLEPQQLQRLSEGASRTPHKFGWEGMISLLLGTSSST